MTKENTNDLADYLVDDGSYLESETDLGTPPQSRCRFDGDGSGKRRYSAGSGANLFGVLISIHGLLACLFIPVMPAKRMTFCIPCILDPMENSKANYTRWS